MSRVEKVNITDTGDSIILSIVVRDDEGWQPRSGPIRLNGRKISDGFGSEATGARAQEVIRGIDKPGDGSAYYHVEVGGQSFHAIKSNVGRVVSMTRGTPPSNPPTTPDSSDSSGGSWHDPEPTPTVPDYESWTTVMEVRGWQVQSKGGQFRVTDGSGRYLHRDGKVRNQMQTAGTSITDARSALMGRLVDKHSLSWVNNRQIAEIPDSFPDAAPSGSSSGSSDTDDNTVDVGEVDWPDHMTDDDGGQSDDPVPDGGTSGGLTGDPQPDPSPSPSPSDPTAGTPGTPDGGTDTDGDTSSDGPDRTMILGALGLIAVAWGAIDA
ncbi:hypothetical protein [Haloplanus rubicundus]|uniref:Uncharacterized protein n=1 Tax=Haloplanus rubicundus TaxID=1547898 RepID=A0A345EBA5_9EURY|nr:hypothetical protein [Haloplanus rubicundus]AXG09477.1 hypothetical protein DU484_06125 [Haloplanus rubicundus]